MKPIEAILKWLIILYLFAGLRTDPVGTLWGVGIVLMFSALVIASISIVVLISGKTHIGIGQGHSRG